MVDHCVCLSRGNRVDHFLPRHESLQVILAMWGVLCLGVFLFEVISILVGDPLVDLRRCTRVIHVFDLYDWGQFLGLFKVFGGGLEVVWNVGINVFYALVKVYSLLVFQNCKKLVFHWLVESHDNVRYWDLKLCRIWLLIAVHIWLGQILRAWHFRDSVCPESSAIVILRFHEVVVASKAWGSWLGGSPLFNIFQKCRVLDT